MAEGEEQKGASTADRGAEEEKEFLPGFSSLEDYSKALLGHVMQATKSCNGLPVESDDFDYYSSFPGYMTFCSKMKSRVDRTISRLLRHQQLPCYWPVGDGGGSGGGAGGVASEDGEVEVDVDEKFETLVEANDILLERVTMLLDEAAGVKLNEQPILPPGVQQGTAEVASWNKRKESVREQVGSYKFIHARNIQRPQLKFRDQVDNSNNPFIPLIRCKPNAKKPLPEMFQKLQNPTSLNAVIENAREWSTSQERFVHPYQFELEHFEPTEEQLQLSEPQVTGSLEDTPLTLIATLEQLQQLKLELMNVKEFAVDMEHHSYRSYLGFVCLMQISTRNHDYLIDTLEVRHHMHILLEPFTDPNIVKVLHGADWDVLWLQRDFGLYIVNMFDTGQASRVLNLPKYSLAFLLQYCCNVQADKQFQLADWRIRPLPPELIKYAREDTHYLLYIYDRQRNELLRRGNKQNNLLCAVIDQSRQLCLKKYEKPIFSEDGYLKLYYKHKRQFNVQQLHCLCLLYAWRDNLARTEDESCGFVLPNHMLFQISEILPREAQGVLACCNPIPTLLRQQLQEVYMLVQKARETPLDEPLPQLTTPSLSTRNALNSSKFEVEETDNDDGSTSFVSKVVQPTGPPVKAAKSKLTVFQDGEPPKLSESVQKRLDDVRRTLPDILGQYVEAKFMSPEEVLQRHLLMIDSQQQQQLPVTPSPARGGETATASSVEMTPASRLEEGAKSKEKRTLSVREIGLKDKGRSLDAIASDETVRKKPRTSFGGGTPSEKSSDFRPFQYEGKNFSDFARGSSGPSEVYDPYSDHGRSGGRHERRHSAAVSRSRVHQKGGERSHTYSHYQGRGGNGRRPSWPK